MGGVGWICAYFILLDGGDETRTAAVVAIIYLTELNCVTCESDCKGPVPRIARRTSVGGKGLAREKDPL